MSWRSLYKIVTLKILMQKKVIVIGAGFAGLSAAAFMAKAGWEVHVLERHDQPGGRARQLKEAGFTFDMGPSWYWMPDVFEHFFAQFGKSVSDYYQLQRLDPSYRVYWEEGFSDLPADLTQLKQLFESIEAGAGASLGKFLEEARYKYEVGINRLVYKPGQSVAEFLDWKVIKGIFRLDVFTSMKKHVEKYFRHPRLKQIMEFPVLFLGALPEDTPALYSLMNYADIVGGTWYPGNGMYSIVQGMYQLAREAGVHFHFNQDVKKIVVENGKATGVIASPKSNDSPKETISAQRSPVNGQRSTVNDSQSPVNDSQSTTYHGDIVIGAADYHFIETRLLDAAHRSYSHDYWERRVMAPSSLLYYVGLNKKLHGLTHHALFFDVPFDRHAEEIYKQPSWPREPLFYLSATSVTDDTVAPAGCENLFILIPVAAGLKEDTEAVREKYFDIVVRRIEQRIGQSITEAIIYKRSFAHTDFVNEYNAFRGNAYGLANTLRQTAILKPSLKSKKVENLFFTGQLTVPGPGVPPSLISGEVVATEILRRYK
jgi:phytoene desaturase